MHWGGPVPSVEVPGDEPPPQVRGESDVPRYLVERSFPETLRVPMTEAGAAACASIVEVNAGAGVTWLHSYVRADKLKSYCVYEGPDPESIRVAAARCGLPVDHITEVMTLDPYFYR